VLVGALDDSDRNTLTLEQAAGMVREFLGRTDSTVEVEQ
jgi:hypothetical protein